MSKRNRKPKPQVLVIGCGSALRCDDAAGLRTAEQVARWRRKNVRSMPVHQLTPEIALDLSCCDLAIFVDACAEPVASGVRLEHVPVEGHQAHTRRAFAHIADPRHLLELTSATYGRRPDAWVIGIPASRFDLGEKITEPTWRHIDEALTKIRHLIDHAGQVTS